MNEYTNVQAALLQRLDDALLTIVDTMVQMSREFQVIDGRLSGDQHDALIFDDSILLLQHYESTYEDYDVDADDSLLMHPTGGRLPNGDVERWIDVVENLIQNEVDEYTTESFARFADCDYDYFSDAVSTTLRDWLDSMRGRTVAHLRKKSVISMLCHLISYPTGDKI